MSKQSDSFFFLGKLLLLATVFLLTLLTINSLSSKGVYAQADECQVDSDCGCVYGGVPTNYCLGPNYCCVIGGEKKVCNDKSIYRCVSVEGHKECFPSRSRVAHIDACAAPCTGCATPTPTPTPGPDCSAFGSCDTACGTCGWRDACGSCHTNETPNGQWCCKRICSGSNCITVSSGRGEANQCDTNAQCCATTAPDAPTLVSPEHGVTITTDSVTLTWNAISNWGNQCGDTTQDVYRVYMDTSSTPTTQRCLVNSGSPTNCSVSSLSETTYYWKVRTDSGVRQTDSTTRAFTVNLNAGAWFQVKDADIQSGGNLVSKIPAQCTLPTCDPKFDLDGTGGYPGVCAYGGTTANFGSGTVSSKGWLANSPYAGRRYDYAFFEKLTPDGAFQTPITESEITGGDLISGFQSGGYIWRYRNGNLTINGTTNLGIRKVILLVDGNLTINGRITLDDGTGFFAAFVSGNIAVDPTVSHPNQPALEGVFMADGTISTGTRITSSDNRLYIRGMLAAWGGINLQRDLDPTKASGANNTSAAEFIEYAPDLVFSFPRELARRGIVWREIAP